MVKARERTEKGRGQKERGAKKQEAFNGMAEEREWK